MNFREDFPILQERVNGRPLIWLDNAATTQKPKQVIDRISYFYEHENSNIHRAAHELAARATDAYEGAREKVRQFLNAGKDVTCEHTQYHNAPSRFEAGTGNIADAVGLGAAIDYVTKLGMDLINQHEHYLLVYATRLLKDVPGLRLVGTAHDKASVLLFTLQGYTNDEVGQALNQEGIAVRTGHHCAQPILRRFGPESTVRPSLTFYNTCSDVDTLVSALYHLQGNRQKK